MALGLLRITQVVLKGYKLHQYSNVPYSAYKTSLLLENNPAKVKQRLGKFRYRSNITTLRAPKHFKVGRQHYSKGGRCSVLSFSYPVVSQPHRPYTHSSLKVVASQYLGSEILSTQQPLSTTKTVRITLGLKAV